MDETDALRALVALEGFVGRHTEVVLTRILCCSPLCNSLPQDIELSGLEAEHDIYSYGCKALGFSVDKLHYTLKATEAKDHSMPCASLEAETNMRSVVGDTTYTSRSPET